MIVHHPKARYEALNLFSCFVNLLIHQIDEDKLEVTRADQLSDSLYLKIWLIKDKEIKKELCITFSHEEMRGWESVTPIERFEFTLCQGCIVKAQVISQRPDEYDEMLLLLKACVNYFKRHDITHYSKIIEAIDLESLERKNWKKSKKDIKQELANNTDIRMAAQDFERKKEQLLAHLTSKYLSQGYEITE